MTEVRGKLLHSILNIYTDYDLMHKTRQIMVDKVEMTMTIHWPMCSPPGLDSIWLLQLCEPYSGKGKGNCNFKNCSLCVFHEVGSPCRPDRPKPSGIGHESRQSWQILGWRRATPAGPGPPGCPLAGRPGEMQPLTRHLLLWPRLRLVQ